MRPGAGNLELLTQRLESVFAVEVRDGGAGLAPDGCRAGEHRVGECGAHQGAARTGAANLVERGHTAQMPALPRFQARHGEFGGRILVYTEAAPTGRPPWSAAKCRVS